MNIRDENIIPFTMLKINVLNKTQFSGSSHGMRYIIKKEIENEKPLLKVYTYKDILNFNNTDKKDIKTMSFDFSDEGIEKAIDYLNEIRLEYQ